MIPVSSAFKEAMKRPVKELDAYIRIDANDSITSADDLISIKISCDSSMCKAAMRKLEAKYTGEHNLLGQWVHVGFGVKLPSTGTFDYLDYGSFLITEIKTSKDTDVTEIVAYDKMVNAMTKYEELETTYPKGLFAYTQLLCQACNLTLGNESFATNNNWQVTEELWKNISGVTYRDIFQQIAQVTGTTCIISNDDKIYFKTINATGETLTYDNLFKLKLEPIYGEINSVVLSREPITGEDVYMKDDASILANGLTEFKIDNNQIVDKRREAAITPIYNALHGISFYPFEAHTEGLGWYEIGDSFDIINDTNDTFNTTLFNYNIVVDGGIKETLKTNAETKTQSQYEYATKTSKRLANAEITVNKQQNEITALVESTDEIQKEINPTDTSSGSSIYLEDSAETELIDFELEGKTEQETSTQSANLCPPFTDSRWAFTNGASVTNEGYLSVPATTGARATITIPWNKSRTCYFKDIIVSGGNAHYTGEYFNESGTQVSSNGKAIYDKGSNFQDETMWGGDNQYGDALTQTTSIKFTILFSNYTPNAYVIKNLIISENNISYIPFTPNMPSPDYPSELVSVGYENLANPNEMSFNNATYDTTTGIYSASDNDDRTYLQLKIQQQNSSHNFIQGTQLNKLVEDVGIVSFTGTIVNNASYIRVANNGQSREFSIIIPINNNLQVGDNYTISFNIIDKTIGAVKLKEIQLEKGTQAHSYIPYGKYGIEVETKDEDNNTNTYLYTLDNPLRSIGDTKDLLYIKNGMLYVERKIGSIVLDGSENWSITSSTSSRTILYTPIDDIEDYISSNNMPNLKSNYFNAVTQQATWKNGDISRNTVSKNVFLTMINGYTVSSFKSWLSTHNTEVQYILAEPYTEELGQVDMPSTYKGITYLNTTDELEPNMNITYVRDTVIANYVESHVSELKINEQGIESRVQTIEESDYGSRINAVEERTTDTEHSIEVISTNIDTTTGEVRKVTTTNGMTFDENGLNIHTNQSTFNAQHTYEGTYYRDGEEVITETTINGFKATNLKNKGQHEYSYDDTNDLYEFIDERVEVDGEYCYATFYNGEE